MELGELAKKVEIKKMWIRTMKKKKHGCSFPVEGGKTGYVNCNNQQYWSDVVDGVAPPETSENWQS